MLVRLSELEFAISPRTLGITQHNVFHTMNSEKYVLKKNVEQKKPAIS